MRILAQSHFPDDLTCRRFFSNQIIVIRMSVEQKGGPYRPTTPASGLLADAYNFLGMRPAS